MEFIYYILRINMTRQTVSVTSSHFTQSPSVLSIVSPRVQAQFDTILGRNITGSRKETCPSLNSSVCVPFNYLLFFFKSLPNRK